MHQVKGRLKSAGESFKVLMEKVLWGIIMFSLFSSGSFTVSASAEHYPSPDYCDGIPTEIREYCEHIGYEFDICPEILEALAYRESRFYPDVTNGNHYGLMQVNVVTHKDRIEKYGWDAADMFDPEKTLSWQQIIFLSYMRHMEMRTLSSWLFTQATSKRLKSTGRKVISAAMLRIYFGEAQDMRDYIKNEISCSQHDTSKV